MAQNIKFSSLSCLFYLMILTVLKYYREGMCYRKVFSYNKKIILRFSCEKGYRILWSYGVNEKPHRSDSLHSYGCYTDVCLTSLALTALGLQYGCYKDVVYVFIVLRNTVYICNGRIIVLIWCKCVCLR